MFLIVRCFKCGHFSVKQETKSPKWTCKLCGTLQSQTRVFSSAVKARDLRATVQQFNMQRGEFEEKQKQIEARTLDAVVATINNNNDNKPTTAQVATRNEWDQFVENQDVNDSDNSNTSENDDGDGVALRTTALVALEGNRRAKATTTKKRLASNVNSNDGGATDTNVNANDWTESQVSKTARWSEQE